MCLLSIYMSSLGKKGLVCQVLCPFNWVSCLFIVACIKPKKEKPKVSSPSCVFSFLYTSFTFTENTSGHQTCGDFPPHEAIFCDTSWVCCNSPGLLTNGYRSEIPTALPLGSINLLERLMELRETFTYGYQFIINGDDKGYRWTSRWKRWVGQGMWEGTQIFHALSRHATFPAPSWLHQAGSSRNPVLWGFLWMLHHVGMINH